MRYFYEEYPELHVIAAGSLLEFALNDISFPVGRLQMLQMHPLCFEEYLIATGNDLLAENYTNPTIKKAFELIETARLYTKVRATSPIGLPLGANASEKKFKSVFLDIGLMSNLCGFYSDKTIHKKRLTSAYNGKMAEQFVGQELRYTMDRELYYWSREARGSTAENDYLFQKEGEIIPIEVKSGTSGRIRSLHLLLESFPNIKMAYVFTEDKYGELPEKGIKFMPLFKAGSI